MDLRLTFGLRYSGNLDPAEESMTCSQSIQQVPGALTAELGFTHVEVRNKNSDARYSAYILKTMWKCVILASPQTTQPGLILSMVPHPILTQHMII